MKGYSRIVGLLLLLQVGFAFAQEGQTVFNMPDALRLQPVNNAAGSITFDASLDAMVIESNAESEKAWDLQFSQIQPVSGFNEGDALLLSFEAMYIPTDPSIDIGKTLVVVKPDDTWKGIVSYSASIPQEWKTFKVPFKSTKTLTKDQVRFTMHAAFAKQKIVIKNLKVVNYGADKSIDELPNSDKVDMADWRQSIFAKDLPPGAELLMSMRAPSRVTKIENDAGSVEYDDSKGGLYVTSVARSVKPWDVQFSEMDISGGIKQGDVLLLAVRAKTLYSNLETGEAKATLNVTPNFTWKAVGSIVLSFSDEWKIYYSPFTATRDLTREELAFTMHSAYAKQSFVISDLMVFNFADRAKKEDLPVTRIKYKGMEPDAQWRVEAQERIETYRKGDVAIKVVDKKGNPVSGAPVKIIQNTHHFKFGDAISSRHFLEVPRYQQHILKNYNLITYANDTKWGWYDDKGRKPYAFKAYDIFKANDIAVRGHVLLWPSYRTSPKYLLNYKEEPEKIRDAIHSNLETMTKDFKGKLIQWDALNEPYNNTDFAKLLGEEILYDAFRIPHEIDPDVPLYYNEFGLLSNGGNDTVKHEWTYKLIQRIDSATNGALSGIGFQSHIGSNATPPETLVAVLQKFSKLGKDIAITEFTHKTTDEVIQAQYLRDFYMAAFSIPHVTTIIQWGSWERLVTDPEMALYNLDWTYKPNGRAYENLVHSEWKTTELGETNENGVFNARGFLGDYTYMVKGNKIIEGEMSISSNSDATEILVTLK